jgi:hypothetical protein
MRNLLLLAPALLGACSANPAPSNIASPPQQPASDSATPPEPTPIHGVTSGHKCTTERTARFIGQLGSDQTGNAILKASNAEVIRWSPPNTMLTMDYREDRVTVWLDSAKKITKIRCG